MCRKEMAKERGVRQQKTMKQRKKKGVPPGPSLRKRVFKKSASQGVVSDSFPIFLVNGSNLSSRRFPLFPDGVAEGWNEALQEMFWRRKGATNNLLGLFEIFSAG